MPKWIPSEPSDAWSIFLSFWYYGQALHLTGLRIGIGWWSPFDAMGFSDTMHLKPCGDVVIDHFSF